MEESLKSGGNVELNLTEVMSFTVLAQERHYRRAADRLHVSTSCLSKRIQRLEGQLGTTLVERGPGGVLDITGSGRLFAMRAERLLDDAHRLATSTHTSVPSVVVGVPGVDGGRLLERWAKRQPRSVREILSALVFGRGVAFDQMDVALQSARVDIMLTAGPSGQPRVRSTRLWPMTRVGLVPRSHPLSGRRAVAAEQFAALPLLRSPAAPPEWMSLWCLGDVRPMEEARVVAIRPRNVADVLAKVAQGSAAAVSQRVLSPALPSLVSCLTLEGLPPSWFYAHTRDDEPRQIVLEVLSVLEALPALPFL